MRAKQRQPQKKISLEQIVAAPISPIGINSADGDDDTILKSIEKHMDSLEKLLGWALAASIVVAWAGVDNQSVVKVLGLEITRQKAFYVTAALYLLANLGLLVLFLRLGDLMLQLDERRLIKGVKTLSMHALLFNPFADFGPDTLARLHAAPGYGLLIIAWWFCSSSLLLLRPRPMRLVDAVANAAFLVLGLASMIAIQRVHRIVTRRTTELNSGFGNRTARMEKVRLVSTLLCTAVGAAIYWIAGQL